MAQIQISTMINAPLEKVWDIVSDLDNETKYWKGTKEIRNISSAGNKITREITIAFRDSKCMQEVTLFPKEKIERIKLYLSFSLIISEKRTFSKFKPRTFSVFILVN